MTMHLVGIWVETSDELPVFDRRKIFLALDDNGFVRPYCISQPLDIIVLTC